MMRRCTWPLVCLMLMVPPAACAQKPPAPPPPPPTTQISNEQFQQLLRQQEQMRREIEQLKAERPAVPPTTQPAVPTTATGAEAAAAAAPAAPAVTQADLDDIETQMRKLGDQVHSALPGTEHLVIAGDAAIGFVNQPKANSTFFAGVSPLFLWEPTDRLLFEAAFDLGIATDAGNASSTSIDLTIANASYIVNDHLIVGGGLFVVPFGQYHNHFDPPWINKLPDDPLAFSDGGIAPASEVGFFARGAFAVGSAKVTYDAYLANGPNLITKDPAAAGSLNFHDFTDLNNGKAGGGRLGFLPVPGLEVGYSAEFAQVAPNDFAGRNVDAFLQAADLNWVQEIRPIGGVLTARAEWVWTDVGKATFDPAGRLGFGPLRFGNFRQGGYALLAYRPTLSNNAVLRNLEFVFRYDALRVPPAAPGGDHEQRYAFGVDYWLTPSAVLKVAYEIDDKRAGVGQDAFFIQFGLGL